MCPMLSVGCTNELLRPAAYPVSRDTKKTPPPKNHHESATEASQPPKTSTLKVQPWKHPQNTNTTSATPTLDCRMQKHDQQSAANTASARLPQCKVKIWSQNLSVWPNRKTIRPWYHEKDTPKPVRSQRLNQSPSPRDTLYWKRISKSGQHPRIYYNITKTAHATKSIMPTETHIDHIRLLRKKLDAGYPESPR